MSKTSNIFIFTYCIKQTKQKQLILKKHLWTALDTSCYRLYWNTHFLFFFSKLVLFRYMVCKCRKMFLGEEKKQTKNSDVNSVVSNNNGISRLTKFRTGSHLQMKVGQTKSLKKCHLCNEILIKWSEWCYTFVFSGKQRL